MKYYTIVAAESLTEAVEITLRGREGNQVWIVLSLDGNRYYRFHSQANLGQMMYRQATRMVALNAEIRGEVIDRATVNQKAHVLGNQFLLPDARNRRGLVDEDGHAEEFLIANWKEVVAEYISATGKGPKKAEIVLSHTPCQAGDQNPSKARLIDDSNYSASCRSKLYQFFKTNSSVKWKVYYVDKFGVVENLNEEQVAETFEGMDFQRAPKELRDVIDHVRANR